MPVSTTDWVRNGRISCKIEPLKSPKKSCKIRRLYLLRYPKSPQTPRGEFPFSPISFSGGFVNRSVGSKSSAMPTFSPSSRVVAHWLSNSAYVYLIRPRAGSATNTVFCFDLKSPRWGLGGYYHKMILLPVDDARKQSIFF